MLRTALLVPVRPSVLGLSVAALASLALLAPVAEGQVLGSFNSVEEALAFLEDAEVVSREEMEAGTNKKKFSVELQKGGVRARAVHRFMYEQKPDAPGGFVDAFTSEIAAFELGRLLGIDTIPPVVMRKVKGKRGALQLWASDVVTEGDRRTRGRGPQDPAIIEPQLQTMRAFDALIANLDRNSGNMLWSSTGELWLIDHTRSFGGHTELRNQQRLSGCSREFWERLQSVSDGEIRDRVRPYVKNYVDALLKRRDLLIAHFERQITARGESAVIFDFDLPEPASQP